MATEVSICSNALLLLGEKTITALTDGTTRANLCNQFYAETRDDLLRLHPWRFAIGRQTLAQDATYAASWEFAYSYPLPVDCLRVLKTSIDDTDEWQREGMALVCNSAAVSIKFIRQITDTAKFDPNFIKLLEYELAMKLAKPVTGSIKTAFDINQIRAMVLQDARTMNGMEGTPDELDTNILVDVR